MVEIFILGQRYEVPESLTILKAFEWSGFFLTRGVGCRGGFCGACGTVYRLQNDHKLYYALACQTVIQPGMILGQIPFFPAQRPIYTCTKACPQEIDVLNYMSAILRGDIAAAAEISFDCIACGLCTARCPAELAPPNVSLLARRLYGKYLAPQADHLRRRVQEIEGGAYQGDLAGLKSMPLDGLKAQYAARQIEV
jgi:hypothetical protein